MMQKVVRRATNLCKSATACGINNEALHRLKAVVSVFAKAFVFAPAELWRTSRRTGHPQLALRSLNEGGA